MLDTNLAGYPVGMGSQFHYSTDQRKAIDSAKWNPPKIRVHRSCRNPLDHGGTRPGFCGYVVQPVIDFGPCTDAQVGQVPLKHRDLYSGKPDPARPASLADSAHNRAAAASSCAAFEGVATRHWAKYLPVMLATSGEDAR